MTNLRQLTSAPGAHSLRYDDPAFPERPILLHSACPHGFTSETPVVFVHHGVGRNGAAYRDYWASHVDDARMLVISVEFTEASFPDYLRYHFGNMHAEDGTPNPREQWTYGVVPRLFEALCEQGVTVRRSYGLFGHSAGGQFVHRMLSFGFRECVSAAISANAGTYAMPDLSVAWPFGLGQTGLDDDGLRAILEFPLTIMTGTEDTRTTGRFFPKGPRSMKQGANRHERAHVYLRNGHDAARRLGTQCAWKLIEVPGVGHSGRGMSVAAVPILKAALNRGEHAGMTSASR